MRPSIFIFLFVFFGLWIIGLRFLFSSFEKVDSGIPRAIFKNWVQQGNSIENNNCGMDECFEFSFCSLSKPFSFFLYPLTISNSNSSKNLHRILSNHRYRSRNANFSSACVFILLVNNCEIDKIETMELPANFGSGRNHVVWFSGECENKEFHALGILKKFGQAILVSGFEIRQDFDIIVGNWQTDNPPDYSNAGNSPFDSEISIESTFKVIQADYANMNHHFTDNFRRRYVS